MTEAEPRAESIPCPLPPDRVAWWKERRSHFPEARALLLPLLHDLQDQLGCLTRDAMRWAAAFTGVTPVEVLGVATFYWMYDFAPRPRHRIAVCRNISCDLRGKDAILDAIRDELDIEAGATTSADGEWSLRTVECMGACTAAPMMDVDGRYYEELTAERTREVLRRIRAGTEELPACPAALPDLPEVAWTYDGGPETGR